MTTFFTRNLSLFREAGDFGDLISYKRIAGKFENYVDPRSWHILDESRRNYILEVLHKVPNDSKAFPCNFISIDMMIDLLLARKNAETEKLKDRLWNLSQLLSIYEGLKLTRKQEEHVESLKSEMYLTDEFIEEIREDPLAVEILSTTSKKFEDKSTNVIDREKDELQLCIKLKDQELRDKKNWALEAIKELDTLKHAIDEKNVIQNQLRHAKLKIETLQNEKAQLVKTVKSYSKPSPLEILEKDLEEMRQNIGPGQELDLIHKELEVLKCYCEKLSEIHQENIELKREIEYFKNLFGGKHGPLSEKDVEKFLQFEKHRQELITHIKSIENENSHLKTENDLLNQNLQKLSVVKNELQSKIKKIRELEVKIKKLKDKADEAKKFEDEVKILKNKINDMEIIKKKSMYQEEEIRNLKEEVDVCNRIIANLRCECEEYKDKVSEMHKYVEEVQSTACQSTLLQYQLEQYKRMLDDVEQIKMDKNKLEKQLKDYNYLEKEIYQTIEINKMLSMEKEDMTKKLFEKENIIMDQELEIKKLIRQVDSMSGIVNNHIYGSFHQALKDAKLYQK